MGLCAPDTYSARALGHLFRMGRRWWQGTVTGGVWCSCHFFFSFQGGRVVAIVLTMATHMHALTPAPVHQSNSNAHAKFAHMPQFLLPAPHMHMQGVACAGARR